MPRTPRPAYNHGGGGGDGVTNELGDDIGTSSNSSGSELLTSQLPSVADPQISYNLPQWLASEKQTARAFSVPLPNFPVKTKQAIRSYLLKTHNYSQKPIGKDSALVLQNLKTSRQEEKQATSNVKTAKDKLAQALLLKSEKLKEIRKAQEVENKTITEKLEQTIRDEQRKEYKKVEQQIKEDCKLEYQRKIEEEMSNKRKREKEKNEEEWEHEEKALSSASAKEDTDANDDGIDGGKTSNKIEELKQKRKEIQAKIEKLSEKKREMFWLLKQVIRQEAMRKMKKKKLKATLK